MKPPVMVVTVVAQLRWEWWNTALTRPRLSRDSRRAIEFSGRTTISCGHANDQRTAQELQALDAIDTMYDVRPVYGMIETIDRFSTETKRLRKSFFGKSLGRTTVSFIDVIVF